MDKTYVTLFKELAQTTAAVAETVMDYDREQGDDNGLKTATIMRDDFQDLVARIDVTEYVISKADAAKLMVGAMVQVNQLQTRIEELKKVLVGYNSDVIPKLQLVVDATDDDEAMRIANEKFIITDN